jgi:hypothetical protein
VRVCVPQSRSVCCTCLFLSAARGCPLHVSSACCIRWQPVRLCECTSVMIPGAARRLMRSVARSGGRKLLTVPSWAGPIMMDESGTEPRIPPGYFAKSSQTISVVAHCIYAGAWGACVRLSFRILSLYVPVWQASVRPYMQQPVRRSNRLSSIS